MKALPSGVGCFSPIAKQSPHVEQEFIVTSRFFH